MTTTSVSTSNCRFLLITASMSRCEGKVHYKSGKLPVLHELRKNINYKDFNKTDNTCQSSLQQDLPSSFLGSLSMLKYSTECQLIPVQIKYLFLKAYFRIITVIAQILMDKYHE